MAYDGFGNFTRAYNWVADKLASIKIQAARMDGEFDNFATALNQVILRNGVAAFTGDLKLGGNKVTGVGAGAEATPSIQYSADATTGMFFPAAGVVGLSAAGVLRFACNSTGAYVPSGQLFGIGTATPRTQLDVVGIASFRSAFEDTIISAAAATGTINLDATVAPLMMLTLDAVANWTFNVRGDAGASLNSIMAIGQTITFAVEVPQGATAYYCTAITVDGAAPAAAKWAGGGAPTAGNASGVDIYAIRVTKTANATFQVRASQSQEK